MARRWTKEEFKSKRLELYNLYVLENKTIGEAASILGLGESTVYDRLMRLNILPCREKKVRCNNCRNDIIIPKKYNENVAEFVGILLGDGHLTPTQVTITLGKKECKYARYTLQLINKIFGIWPKKIIDKEGDTTIYFGSTKAVRWFLGMGLCFNKKHAQVNVPEWVFRNKKFVRAVLRGLFDTDGSVYKLKYGVQISFCNMSIPLLESVKKMLVLCGLNPSRVSSNKVYITRKADLGKFLKEIGFANPKHQRRFTNFNNGRVA